MMWESVEWNDLAWEWEKWGAVANMIVKKNKRLHLARILKHVISNLIVYMKDFVQVPA